MPVKIRLTRHGKKSKPFYHIVIADSRAPRDGKFVERIGSYNPTTHPAIIDLDFDKALTWLQKGAQPTDTVRNILSLRGVLMKNHLLKGAAKGAFSEEEAERRFQIWLKEKETKVQKEKDEVQAEKDKATKERLEAEAKLNEERKEAIAKKRAEELAAIEAEKKAKEEAKAAENEESKDEAESAEAAPEEPTPEA